MNDPLGVKGQITVATANIDKNPVWFKSGRKEYQACNLQTPEYLMYKYVVIFNFLTFLLLKGKTVKLWMLL